MQLHAPSAIRKLPGNGFETCDHERGGADDAWCMHARAYASTDMIPIPARANFFFGRTFDLVSQNFINYACVVKVLHTPNARAYVAVLFYVLCLTQPQPHPQISE